MSHPLVDQFRFTRSEWRRGLEEITEEEGSCHFGSMNSISWTVGHLAWHEQRTFLQRPQNKVLFPQQLYQTLPRVEDSAGQWYSEDRIPRVPAPRPLQTYYRGLFADVDAVEKVMPGKRDIEVVSTVRLYYAAPDRPQLAK